MRLLFTPIFVFLSLFAFSQELTTIEVYVPNKEDEVYIVGNQDALGNWQADQVKMEKVSDLKRSITLKLEFPAEFKFTKGSWESEGIVKSLSHNPNLRIENINDEKSFEVKTWMDNIQSEKLDLDYDIKFINSEFLGDKRMIKVYLPQNYSPDKKYPVIYLTDGETQNFEVAKGYINALSQPSFNIIPPTILVGIVHKNRNEELFNQQSGKYFTEYLLQELIPYINSAYSTSGFNAMIGHSNGAEYNHILMMRNDNTFRGFISLSTSFAGMGNKENELAAFFRQYDGTKMFYFLANATMDSPDRILYGNTIDSLYKKNPNTNIEFSKKTFDADHVTIVPHAMLDGLKYIYQDYKNMEAYPTIYDYSKNYLANLKETYGIDGKYEFLDLQGYFSDIIGNRKLDEYKFLINFIEEQKLWLGGGFDPINISNHYAMMKMYPENITYYTKGLEGFDGYTEKMETFPILYFSNITKAIDSYKMENKISEGIAFLEKSREKLSEPYFLEMTYYLAKVSLENGVDLNKGKEALNFCKNNFRKNNVFTMEDLKDLENH
ncbi:MAG: hypothetical protein HWE09_06350 [Cyclobacteriaceae bacterium]|nr:hypothetical protein [Cyclobacteriaceae bacterium]